MKITELLERHKELNRISGSSNPFFSFEIFPPKTEEGIIRLHKRLNTLADLEPLYIDITWGAGGSSTESSLKICKRTQQLHGVQTMLHMTCETHSRKELVQVLQKAKKAGVRNILALRGDPPLGGIRVDNGLNYGKDLVEFIRKIYGSYFSIAVAGYPETHKDSKSVEEDIMYLKEKVDAGADFIITQLFFDASKYFDFVKRCREAGIVIPIIPGIMPVLTPASFRRMVGMSKCTVPQQAMERLDSLSDNPEAFAEAGFDIVIDMCKELVAGGVPGLHLYTLNRVGPVKSLLERLGFLKATRVRRPFPWRRSTFAKRKTEGVRPVHWNLRPGSYITRTQGWRKFPKEFWEECRGNRFEDLEEAGYSEHHPWKPPEKLPDFETEKDVFQFFNAFARGEISSTPWHEQRSQLLINTIQKKLERVTENGFLVTNFLQRLNGIPSEDILFGFGGPGGYIYQRRYIEFFISDERVEGLIEAVKESPNLTYSAVNCNGSVELTNNTERNTISLTWAVFPNKSIMQPTVFVPKVFFQEWRKEAFGLWKIQWMNLYLDGSKSRKLLDKMYRSYYLVSIIDNDYVHSTKETEFNLWKTLFKFFETMSELKETRKD